MFKLRYYCIEMRNNESVEQIRLYETTIYCETTKMRRKKSRPTYTVTTLQSYDLQNRSTFILLIATFVVLNLYYLSTKSLLLGVNDVSEHKDFQNIFAQIKQL